MKGGSFPEEGWRGPCGVNEVTCHVSGYGENGLMSFDWKHFPYEDYDEFIWGDKGPWVNGFGGEGDRRPEILTLQMGLHSCWHTHPEGLYSTELKEPNSTMIDKHLGDIPKVSLLHISFSFVGMCTCIPALFQSGRRALL